MINHLWIFCSIACFQVPKGLHTKLILKAISNIFLAIVMILRHIVFEMLNIINSSLIGSVFNELFF